MKRQILRKANKGKRIIYKQQIIEHSLGYIPLEKWHRKSKNPERLIVEIRCSSRDYPLESKYYTSKANKH